MLRLPFFQFYVAPAIEPAARASSVASSYQRSADIFFWEHLQYRHYALLTHYGGAAVT
jgi:thymidylate synthase